MLYVAPPRCDPLYGRATLFFHFVYDKHTASTSVRNSLLGAHIVPAVGPTQINADVLKSPLFLVRSILDDLFTRCYYRPSQTGSLLLFCLYVHTCIYQNVPMAINSE